MISILFMVKLTIKTKGPLKDDILAGIEFGRRADLYKLNQIKNSAKPGFGPPKFPSFKLILNHHVR